MSIDAAVLQRVTEVDHGGQGVAPFRWCPRRMMRSGGRSTCHMALHCTVVE